MQLTHQLQEAFNSEPEEASLQAYDLQTEHKKPVVRKPYRPPLNLKPSIDREIDQLLKLGIIQPSTSPWSSPVIPVPKKDGSVRLCVDFRWVNEHTLQDTYPLPRVDDLLAQVSAKQFLTTLDLSYQRLPPSAPHPRNKRENCLCLPQKKISVHLITIWTKECTCSLSEADGSDVTRYLGSGIYR